MNHLARIVGSMDKTRIMVAGDLMLDNFVRGEVERISPEAPVPVFLERAEDKMLGGVGNVIANLAALGVTPVAFAVTGDDEAGAEVRNLIGNMGVNPGHLVKDETRPTIRKTRYLAQGQQLLRIDSEQARPLSADRQKEILQAMEERMGSVAALVLSDYGKGFFTPSFLKEIIALAKAAGVPVLADPKGRDFSIYAGASFITPNRKELGLATGLGAAPKDDAEVVRAALEIAQSCGIGAVLATRSEDGMSLVAPDAEPVHIRARVQEVYDVSGAGDTVIATFAAALAAGAQAHQAAALANIAAGIAVSKAGTAAVRRDEIEKALASGEKETASPYQAPCLGWDAAAAQIREWQARGLKVGMTGGCFDIIHYGHVNYLNAARGKCDRLVVALNHDVSVKLLKGPERPVNDEAARATVMGSLGSVDLTVLFGAEQAGADNTPCALLDKLRPDIFFKGGDYTAQTLPETKVVHGYGGEVAIMPLYEGYSTTNIIEKTRQTG
ncbi:MAG: D-glycero-beta-D-manno-heptose-7-phosphate kinase [Micavibrio sp.]